MQEHAQPLIRLIFIGLPASGKGTQAKRIAESFSIKHLTTGGLLRELAKQDTEDAKKIKLDRGGGIYPRSRL